MNTKVITIEKVVKKTSNGASFVVDVAILTAIGTAAAWAATGGPFSTINNFLDGVLLPGIGVIGVGAGIGYAALHGFKHDYGRAIVGAGVATAGGVMIHNSSWFASQAGVSAATIGGHLPVLSPLVHLLGF